jgi:hypothetical protein
MKYWNNKSALPNTHLSHPAEMKSAESEFSEGEPIRNRKTKNQTLRWLRIIHRNLGFLMAGVCLVYGISGFLLNHMGSKDPAYKTTEETLQIEKNLTHDELSALWKDKGLPEIKRIVPIDEDHSRLMLNGGIGVYNATAGIVDYELHKKNEFIFWINRLHYNKVKGWSAMADLFAFSLIFFALSGLLIVRGKKGLSGVGKWYLLIGLLIPLLYILLS